MEEDVVHAAEEDEVGGFLEFFRRDLEVFVEPGEGLGADEFVALGVGCGRGDAHHRDLVLVDMPEDFGLGDLGDGVVVEQVAGRAVGLVAGDAAMGLRPVVPGLQIGEVELAERLAVVGADAGNGVRIADAGEDGELVEEIVATVREEFLKKRGRPLGGVVFERVVELRARHGRGEFLERLVEGGEVARHGGGGKWIEHVALAAGRGAFDLLDGGFGTEADDVPFPGGREPIEFAVLDLVREIDGGTGFRKRPQALDFPFGQNQADAGAALGFLPDDLETGGSNVRRDLRPAEGPAGAGRHVHAEAEALGLGGGVAEHGHPAG